MFRSKRTKALASGEHVFDVETEPADLEDQHNDEEQHNDEDHVAEKSVWKDVPDIKDKALEIIDRADYMAKQMKETDKMCYLAPYIDPSPNVQHWMLCVINQQDNHVYWLDPLGKGIRPDIRLTVDSGLWTYRAFGGSRNRSARSNTRWTKVKCPIQPGGRECGYYVMCYMRDLIWGWLNPAGDHRIEQCFHGENAYSQEEIDVVRDEWVNYLQECITSFHCNQDEE